jgi:PAS domain S-box-containing protein
MAIFQSKGQPTTDTDRIPIAQLIGAAVGARANPQMMSILASIVQYSGEAIFSRTPDGVITSWNPAAERLYGYSAGEAIGQHVGLIVPPEFATELNEIIETIKQGGRIEHYETRRMHKDGHLIDVSLTISPIRDGNGRLVAASVIGHDITDARRGREELDRSRQELERSNHELEQFAYIASHDLREPLRMVSGYVGLLDQNYRAQLDDRAIEFMDFALDGVRRMERLITDLLTYSRAGKMAPFKAVDVENLMMEVIAAQVLTIHETGAEITYDPLPRVMGDEPALFSLLNNLVGNALKFRGAAPPRIHLRARRDGAVWTFLLSDNGIEIKPKDRQRIFEMFQRAHSQSEYPGSGMGLAICKRIVERHGGTIRVEPTDGAGTTFAFALKSIA